MRSRTTIPVIVVAALALSFALVEPALAQDSNEAGKHLADWLQSISKPLLPAIAGVMCIAALIQRNFGMTMLLLLIVLAGGIFVWAPTELGNFAEKLAKDII
jgi:type IV secretory pathway VirB2 component (pilin)